MPAVQSERPLRRRTGAHRVWVILVWVLVATTILVALRAIPKAPRPTLQPAPTSATTSVSR